PGYCPPMIFEAGGTRQLIVWDADKLSSLDPETGKVYWSQEAKTYEAMSIPTPRQAGDELFVTATGATALLLRLDKDKPGAKVVWSGGPKKPGLYSVFSTPFFDGHYIYGSSTGGELVCLNADTGEKLWGTLAPLKDKKGLSADTFLVKNGDRFFLMTEQGDLIIARLSPKGYEEVGRAHLLEPTSVAFGRDVVWSHPAFANRSVYARDDKELVCVSRAP